MPQAESTTSGALVDATPLLPTRTIVRGWGGGEGVSAMVLAPDGAQSLRSALARLRSARGRRRMARADPAHEWAAIARGLGRSYGDAAQIEGGLVLEMTRFKGFELDPEHGLVTARAGMTIGELLHALVPEGWMVPVVPGTQHVCVGGAG